MKITEIFKEQNGQFSAMRIICIIGVALILGIWTFMCFHQGTILDIPTGVVAALSLFVIGKIGQKIFGEPSNQNPSNSEESLEG